MRALQRLLWGCVGFLSGFTGHKRFTVLDGAAVGILDDFIAFRDWSRDRMDVVSDWSRYFVQTHHRLMS